MNCYHPRSCAKCDRLGYACGDHKVGSDAHRNCSGSAPKALNWRQVATLTNKQLDELLETEGEDVYDDVTIQLAINEYENRQDEDDRRSEMQAAYDDEWSR